MDRLEQIRKEISIEHGYSSWPELSAIEPKIKVSMLQDEVARRYATEVARHNLERAAEQAAIEVESRLSGKTIHGSINSEDPQWVARVNRESITSLEIELI